MDNIKTVKVTWLNYEAITERQEASEKGSEYVLDLPFTLISNITTCIDALISTAPVDLDEIDDHLFLSSENDQKRKEDNNGNSALVSYLISDETEFYFDDVYAGSLNTVTCTYNTNGRCTANQIVKAIEFISSKSVFKGAFFEIEIKTINNVVGKICIVNGNTAIIAYNPKTGNVEQIF